MWYALSKHKEETSFRKRSHTGKSIGFCGDTAHTMLHRSCCGYSRPMRRCLRWYRYTKMPVQCPMPCEQRWMLNSRAWSHRESCQRLNGPTGSRVFENLHKGHLGTIKIHQEESKPGVLRLVVGYS